MYTIIKKVLILIVTIILLLNTSDQIKDYSNETNNIGTIIIKKINLNRHFYPIDSEENTIDKNIMVLKESTMPDIDNSLLILAAHSGTGDIAFFEELDNLSINDEVIIIYQNKKYIYIVKDIWEEKKNGYINLNKENKKQLVLTTCSPNKDNTQLIINCILKES